MKLTRKRILSLILPLLGLGLAAWYYAGGSARGNRPAPQPPPPQAVCRPFQEDGGWGYDIYVNGKKYIHQDRIPGLAGIQPFLSVGDADKVGELVVKKIQSGSGLPAVSFEEMRQLGIRGLDLP